jgi:hypothetical protein
LVEQELAALLSHQQG